MKKKKKGIHLSYPNDMVYIIVYKNGCLNIKEKPVIELHVYDFNEIDIGLFYFSTYETAEKELNRRKQIGFYKEEPTI